VTLIIAVIGFFQLAPAPLKQTVLATQPGLWHVTKVVDGDTIDVANGTQKETVRFLGIDTP
jgi:endonuclease YncB( thermonuclease family)